VNSIPGKVIPRNNRIPKIALTSAIVILLFDEK
jgi:hypothetical protein